MAVAQQQGSEGKKARGVVLGQSINMRPDPPAPDVLPTPLILTDLKPVSIPRRGLRENLQSFLQNTGLRSLPDAVRMRWQANDCIELLQNSLLGGGRGKRISVTHPQQLIPQVEFLMTLTGEVDTERRLIHMLIGRGMIEYRKRISQIREKPQLFARTATSYFFAGYKHQQQLGQVINPVEKFQMVQDIYNNYYWFKVNYISSVISREPAEGGTKLFSKFLRALFFMATVQEDGTLLPRPAGRLLPSKEYVVFLAKRDIGLQLRLAEDEALRAELQNMLKSFRRQKQR